MGKTKYSYISQLISVVCLLTTHSVPPNGYKLETIIINLGITPVSELKNQNHLYASI